MQNPALGPYLRYPQGLLDCEFSANSVTARLGLAVEIRRRAAGIEDRYADRKHGPGAPVRLRVGFVLGGRLPGAAVHLLIYRQGTGSTPQSVARIRLGVFHGSR
jgi:hypothetical protein